MREFLNYLLVIIGLVDIITECFVYMVYNRVKFKNSSYTIYNKALAISDIVGGVLSIREFINLKFHIEINANSEIFCKSMFYLNYSLPAVSPWLLAFISFERFVSGLFVRKTFF